MAKKTPKTQNQIITELADKTGLKKADVKNFFEVFNNVIVSELKGSGVAVIPGVARVKAIRKAATKAREGRNPATGEAMTISAKPARTVVKAYVTKALKEVFA